MPRSSPAERPSILIAAVSGRALAAAAVRAGLTPLVADFFADADTLRLAYAAVRLEDLRGGFRRETLHSALDHLVREAPSPPLGLVYGAGFEDRCLLLHELAARHALIGNQAAAVERVKHPERFFGTLASLVIPHPRSVMQRPAGRGWLSKQVGGAGGSHIKPAQAGEGRKDRSRYFQEMVPGGAISALFVGNGSNARVLGFSEQWTAPVTGAKWRYGGAVQPARLSAWLQSRMAGYVEAAAAAFGLKGLGSADFLVHGDEARLLEINPRPGATLDIFDGDARPLLHLHIQAVLEGILPKAPLPLREATATAIVYASAPVKVAPGLAWPDWTGDQPKPGERIDKGRPICTVLARAATAAEARRLAEERTRMILSICANDNGGNR